MRTWGKPLAFYLDKHSTYKVNRQASIDEDLRDSTARSQFGRAMDELRIELIFANSPQAKGRVERLFETLQDRLVKELRLAGINDKEEGTKYFREVYIPKHNAKFGVAPREAANLHRLLLPTDNLANIFTLQSRRVATPNLVVSYKNTRYQLIPEGERRYLLPKSTVIVREDRDGMVTFRHNEKLVPHAIEVEQVHEGVKIQLASTKEFVERQVYIPPADHPWRQYAYIRSQH